jgi:hypothetical protein
LIVVLLLRVLSVVAVVLGILLVVIACMDPAKSAIDVLARGLLWSIISLIAWAVADVRERLA